MCGRQREEISGFYPVAMFSDADQHMDEWRIKRRWKWVPGTFSGADLHMNEWETKRR